MTSVILEKSEQAIEPTNLEENDKFNEEEVFHELEDAGTTDLEESDKADEEEERIENILPVNTFEKVVYYTNQFSINNLITMIDEKDLDLGDTDVITKENIELNKFENKGVKYQRNFVWETRIQSKFIESLILGLPVPNLIFYTKKNKTSFNVIDGKQRLTTSYLFIKNEIPINTKYLSINGVEILNNEQQKKRNSLVEKDKSKGFEIYFSDLDLDLQKRLNFYRLYVTTIDLDTSLKPDIKNKLEYQIFDRLNTGSVTLSLQEIRNNTIADSYFQERLKYLSNSESFKSIYYTHKDGVDIMNIPGNYTKKKRMYDQELIVRIFFFLENIKLNKEYLETNKEQVFSKLSDVKDLSKDPCIINTLEMPKFYSMKRNLNKVVEVLRNDEKKIDIDKYVPFIENTFDDLLKYGGSDICKKVSAFNISLFESIFISILYCKYYGIDITDKLYGVNEIKNNISEDKNFKEILSKGGSTKKDYIIYKILLGLKNFIN